ncbi:MAG: hypothetical protein ACE5HT_12920 [Gemmatimonadales bacterium]
MTLRFLPPSGCNPGAFLLFLGLFASYGHAQERDSLLTRWVGTHLGRPLHLEFYSDTMLVVNDAQVLNFVATDDSIAATGDTSFAVSYRFAFHRLLLTTEEGKIITMTAQLPLARPLWGRWLGAPVRNSDRNVELFMAQNGSARWRWFPGGTWVEGEWDRYTRIITFMWLPDSIKWTARYDPGGNSLLFDETDEDKGTLILRRVFRRPSN